MDEKAGRRLAAGVGGDVWQSGGGIYVVTVRRPDGAIVVFSDDLVAQYDDDSAFEASAPSITILLRTDPTEYFVVESDDGKVWLQDPAHGRGWTSEDAAKQEASTIQTRVGSRCRVRHQRLSDTIGDKW